MSDPSAPGKSVLVVADPPRLDALVRALAEPLPQGAVEVLASSGGDDTIDLLEARRPHVVVVTATLEIGDSKALVETLRGMVPRAHVAIVVVGDETGPYRTALDAADLAPEGFVTSPVADNALRFAVGRGIEAVELARGGDAPVPQAVPQAVDEDPTMAQRAAQRARWEALADSFVGGPDDVDELDDLDGADPLAGLPGFSELPGLADLDDPEPLPPALDVRPRRDELAPPQAWKPGTTAELEPPSREPTLIIRDPEPAGPALPAIPTPVLGELLPPPPNPPAPRLQRGPSWTGPLPLASLLGAGPVAGPALAAPEPPAPSPDAIPDEVTRARARSVTGASTDASTDASTGASTSSATGTATGGIPGSVADSTRPALREPVRATDPPASLAAFAGAPPSPVPRGSGPHTLPPPSASPAPPASTDASGAASGDPSGADASADASGAASGDPSGADASADASGASAASTDASPMERPAEVPETRDFARQLRAKMSMMAKRLFQGADAAAPPAVDLRPRHDHHTEIDLASLGEDIALDRGVTAIESRAVLESADPRAMTTSPGTWDTAIRERGLPDRGEIVRGISDAAMLLAKMFAQSSTGRISFRHPGDPRDVEKVVYFDQGRPVFASSSEPSDRMGELLVREGKITAAQYERCQAVVAESGRRMGEILVDVGYLKRRELLPAVRRHVEDIVYSLFGWERGTYHVAIDATPCAERIRLSRHPAALILEGIRRKLDRSSLERLIGPPSTVIEVPDRERLGGIINLGDLAPEERAALAAFDGQSDLVTVARAAGVDVADVLPLAWGLCVLGLATARRTDTEIADESSALVGETDLAIDRERVRARWQLVTEADYFALLGVRRDATAFEIRRAYQAARRDFAAEGFPPELRRELAQELDDIANVLDEAFRVLRDDRLRLTYLANLIE